MTAHATAVDAFDLPEWLGEHEVTWRAESGLRDGPHVTGVLLGPRGPQLLGCDLIAVDLAYPVPVIAEEARVAAHQQWQLGEVHLVEIDDRLTLAVPGVAFEADDAMEAVGRFARAVGAAPDRYSVSLRIGGAHRHQ